ncbi:MAG: MFS transporter [Verrucomicrobia bacterium]|nr:MFS transporter [Verrucomicrobiota bacterium]
MAPSFNPQDSRNTRFALLWMNLAAEPLISLYTLIPFILRKDFGSSMFQVSLFITLRPVLSVFSFYWSAYLKEGKGRLIANLISASLLAYLPFLFFPWVDNFGFLLLASAMYQLFSKAAIPSLIEVLKRNIPKAPREHAFSLFFILSFVESGILGLLLGGLLDSHAFDWKMLFFFASLIGLSSIFFFIRLKVPELPKKQQRGEVPASLAHPWKESFRLMRERTDFAHFQGAFMFGGSALMLMAPALSSYYADTLSLTYTNITTARFIFMAIGVAGSSLLWKKGLSLVPLLKLTLWVLVGFGLFPIALLMAQIDLWFLYLAFFIYGVAQAGSHLIWNLSGTYFSSDQDSSPYTRVNILMLGLRGAVMPLIGGLLCDLLGPTPVLILGMFLCLYGARYLFRRSRIFISQIP